MRARYPEKSASRRIPLRAFWRIPLRNKSFVLGVAVVYLIPAILLQSAARRKLRRPGDPSLIDLWDAVLWSKWFLYAGLVIFVALSLFAAAKSVGVRLAAGFLHAVPHVVVLSFFVALAAWLPRRFAGALEWIGFDWAVNAAEKWDLYAAGVGATLAAIPGALLVVLYLILCDAFLHEKLREHGGQVFAGQRIADMKNFLRLHIRDDGTLCIYPIGIKTIPARDDIQLVPTGELRHPWFKLCGTGGTPHLIEDDPIEVR